MSRWIALGITSLSLALLVNVSDAEARGRKSGYCASCQYSMPTVALPAAQAPAAPGDEVAATEASPETPVARVESTQNVTTYTYTPNAGTRRVRWFGRYRN